jgi:hypothetical protein
MPSETPQVNESQAKAAEELEQISSLLRFPPFRLYYQRRLAEKIATLEQSILEDDTITPEELLAQRRLRVALKEIAALPETDAAACRKLLSS